MKKLKHKITSFILLIVFIVPMAISSFHHHQDDEHQSCDLNDVTHLHKLTVDDCSIYHYQLSSTVLFQTKFKEKKVIKNIISVIFNYNSFYKNNHNKLKLVRGPPNLFV